LILNPDYSLENFIHQKPDWLNYLFVTGQLGLDNIILTTDFSSAKMQGIKKALLRGLLYG